MDAALREGKEIPMDSTSTSTSTTTESPATTTTATTTITPKPVKPSKPLTSSKPTQQVISTVKTSPMDSDGKPVQVDQHWKQFMAKSGKKTTPVKRKHGEVEKKNGKANASPVTKPVEVKERKTEYLFGEDDDDEEMNGRVKKTKKIPLRTKK